MNPRVAPYAALGAAAVGCGALALWNPGDDGVPLCPTKAVTGADCPFCGGLRAVAALTRGNPALAADHNLIVVALVPVAAVWWVAWAWSARRGGGLPRVRVPRLVTIAAVLVLVAFTVVRNVGGTANWLNSASS